jgi:S-adenosylhomocysteine hydrolase
VKSGPILELYVEIFAFCKTKENAFIWFITNILKMEPNFLDEGCDVFMNENEIRLEEKMKLEGLKKLQALN